MVKRFLELDIDEGGGMVIEDGAVTVHILVCSFTMQVKQSTFG